MGLQSRAGNINRIVQDGMSREASAAAMLAEHFAVNEVYMHRSDKMN